MQERFELRQYLRELRAPWIDDPSNDDEAFERVKARRAMEELTKLGIDVHVVGRVMDHLGQVRSALDFATHDHALDCVFEEHGDLIIDRRRFAEGSPEVNRRLVAAALRWIASAEYGPRGMKLQEFLSAMMRGRDATLHGVRLLGGKDSFRLTREHAAVAGAVALTGAVWDGRWVVEGFENKDFIVRALGEDGLLQLSWRTAQRCPAARNIGGLSGGVRRQHVDLGAACRPWRRAGAVNPPGRWFLYIAFIALNLGLGCLF